MQKFLRKDSSWIADWAIDHNINTSKYNPLTVRGYSKLTKELYYPKKSLINFQKILTIMNVSYGI